MLNRSRLEPWSVRAVAVLTALMGLLNMLSAITPAMGQRLARLQQISPLEVRVGTRLTAALAGFALCLLAINLWRRKRAAWLFALIILGISAVTHLLKGLNYEEAGVALALALLLVLLRAHFHARSDLPSVRQGLEVLAVALAFTLLYGVAGFYLLDRHFRVPFSPGAAFRQTVVMFTLFYDPGLEPTTGFGHYFANSIYVVGAATSGYAFLMLARPVLVRNPATSAERERAKGIVEAYGCSSLARFALFSDKSYYFNPGGSVVAFVVKGRVAVGLGEPIGPPEDLDRAFAGFRLYCEGNDWDPVLYLAPAEHLEVYRAAGFSTLCVGQEAVVDLAAFTLAGKAGKDLRSPYNRLKKLGYRAELHAPPLDDKLLGQLRAISDEWLSMMQGRERRFATGWFDDDYVRHSPVMAVYTPTGELNAFVNVVPEYQRHEVAIDLMRRREEVENGTMDFLFASLLEWVRQQGYAGLSLGLSALSGIGEHSDDPVIERALGYVYEHINRFYDFKGLHAFKAKFHPQWAPRYLIYQRPTRLPLVATALVRADAGDDFWWGFRRL
jgi:phosphatidylglycerol lysyltransferase